MFKKVLILSLFCILGFVNLVFAENLNLEKQSINNNALLDRSSDQAVVEDLISGKELKNKTVGEIAELYNINIDKYIKELSDYYKISINAEDKFQLLHDNYGIEPSVAKDIAVSIHDGKEINIENKDDDDNDDKEAKHYPFFIVILISSILYLFTYFLSKMNKISKLNHQRFWNVILLFSFLISGILGVLLILRIEFNIIFPLPFNILFWHVELGALMFIVSIFHILDHLNYWKSYFKLK